jgi:hypothetical protein
MEIASRSDRSGAGHRRHQVAEPGQLGGSDRGQGTLIRHAASKPQPGPVGALVIAVVLTAQLTRLVASPGLAQASTPCLATAARTAVDLAPIALAAEVEDLSTKPACSLT